MACYAEALIIRVRVTLELVHLDNKIDNPRKSYLNFSLTMRDGRLCRSSLRKLDFKQSTAILEVAVQVNVTGTNYIARC